MWRIFFVLLAAQMVWAQVVEYKMINIKTKTGDVDASPVFTHLLDEDTCFEFIQRGSSVKFSDDFAGDAVLHQIKTAINNNPHIGIIKDFDRRLRFAIENKGEKYSTDNLKFYFEETAMTDKKRKLYDIQYYALSSDQLNKKYRKSINKIKKYNKAQQDAPILVLTESDNGIYYVSFRVKETDNHELSERINEFQKKIDTINEHKKAIKNTDYTIKELNFMHGETKNRPLDGPLHASVEAIPVPFTFDIKYSNSAGSEHIAKYNQYTHQMGFPVLQKYVANSETGAVQVVNYRLFCKLVPFEYKNDLLKIELILRSEQALFSIHGKRESLISTSITQYLEFKNEDVLEVKLPDNWPPPIQPEWDTALEHQSLVIKPIRE